MPHSMRRRGVFASLAQPARSDQAATRSIDRLAVSQWSREKILRVYEMGIKLRIVYEAIDTSNQYLLNYYTVYRSLVHIKQASRTYAESSDISSER